MADLQLAPQKWFSRSFDVSRAGAPVGQIHCGASWKEKGILRIGDATFEARREHFLGGKYLLSEKERPLANAQKTSALKNSFLLACAGHTYILKKESFLGRSFVLMEEDRQLGLIRPDGMITRKASISLPGDIPLPIQLFIAWLVLVSWRRQSNAGAAAVAAGS